MFESILEKREKCTGDVSLFNIFLHAHTRRYIELSVTKVKAYIDYLNAGVPDWLIERRHHQSEWFFYTRHRNYRDTEFWNTALQTVRFPSWYTTSCLRWYIYFYRTGGDFWRKKRDCLSMSFAEWVKGTIFTFWTFLTITSAIFCFSGETSILFDA